MALKSVSKKEFEKFMKDQEGTVTREHTAGESASDLYKGGDAPDGVLGRVDLSSDGKDDQYFIAQ